MDHPELTAPCSLRGEVKRDNNPPYLFSSVERTRPVMVTMCPSRRPPTILPVKGICCGEETASVGLPSSLHPYQPWPGLAWESGSSLGTQCSHEQDRRSLSSTDLPALERGSDTDILRLGEGAPQALRGCDKVRLAAAREEVASMQP